MELDGRNWLIPVDANLERARDAPDEAIELDRVLERVREAKRLRIVILDACRNNPYLSRMLMVGGRTRAVQRGLADIEPDHGEVVFYSARRGTTAEDGTSEHSPFTTALLKHLGEEGLEISLFFRKVTSDVLASTTPKQQPFVYGSIPADSFYFLPPRSALTAEGMLSPQASPHRAGIPTAPVAVPGDVDGTSVGPNISSPGSTAEERSGGCASENPAKGFITDFAKLKRAYGSKLIDSLEYERRRMTLADLAFREIQRGANGEDCILQKLNHLSDLYQRGIVDSLEYPKFKDQLSKEYFQ